MRTFTDEQYKELKQLKNKMGSLQKEIKKQFNELCIEIKELCISGLLTDGGHHKQWILEEIIRKMGYDLDEIRKELLTPDENGDTYSWEDGIPA